jgi:hypothetical protein
MQSIACDITHRIYQVLPILECRRVEEKFVEDGIDGLWVRWRTHSTVILTARAVYRVGHLIGLLSRCSIFSRDVKGITYMTLMVSGVKVHTVPARLGKHLCSHCLAADGGETVRS